MVALDELKAIEFFEPFDDPTLERLAAHAELQWLPTGSDLVRQHDDARHVYFLVSGAVQFLITFEGIDDLLVGTSDQPGALIGWSAFRAPYRYTASVRCEEPCRVVRLARDLLEHMIDQDAAFGHVFLQRVAVALATRLEQARELLVEPPWLKRRRDEGLQVPRPTPCRHFRPRRSSKPSP